MRTLYRMFKQGVFEGTHLPMKGKRKSQRTQRNSGKTIFFVDHFVTEEMIILNSIKNLATLKGILL